MRRLTWFAATFASGLLTACAFVTVFPQLADEKDEPSEAAVADAQGERDKRDVELATVDVEAPDAQPDVDGGDADVSDGDTEADVLDADADAGDALLEADAPPPCDTTKAFGAPVEVPELNVGGASQRGARLSDDLKTVLFHRADPAGVPARLMRGKRLMVSDPFTVEVLTDITGQAGFATLSADALTMYFESNRSGRPQIWFATRTAINGVFGAPALVFGLEDSQNTGQPYLAPNGELFFVSRHGGGSLDIYRANVVSSGVTGGFIAIPELAEGMDEHSPVVTADGLTIYFGRFATQSGVSSTLHIWSAKRPTKNSPFASPVPEPSLWSAAGNDVPSWISSDGCTMYLASDVDGFTAYKIYAAQRPAP